MNERVKKVLQQAHNRRGSSPKPAAAASTKNSAPNKKQNAPPTRGKSPASGASKGTRGRQPQASSPTTRDRSVGRKRDPIEDYDLDDDIPSELEDDRDRTQEADLRQRTAGRSARPGKQPTSSPKKRHTSLGRTRNGRDRSEDYDLDDEIPSELRNDVEDEDRTENQEDEDGVKGEHGNGRIGWEDFEGVEGEHQRGCIGWEDFEDAKGDVHLSTPPEYVSAKAGAGGGTNHSPGGLPAVFNRDGLTTPQNQKNNLSQAKQGKPLWDNYILWMKAAFIVVMAVAIFQARTLAGQHNYTQAQLSGEGSKYIEHQYVIEDGAQFAVDSLQELRAHKNCSHLLLFPDTPTILDEDQNIDLHKELQGIPAKELRSILSRRLRLLYPEETSSAEERGRILNYTMTAVQKSPQVKLRDWSNGTLTGKQWNGTSEESLLLSFDDSLESRSLGCRMESWVTNSDWWPVIVTGIALFVSCIIALILLM